MRLSVVRRRTRSASAPKSSKRIRCASSVTAGGNHFGNDVGASITVVSRANGQPCLWACPQRGGNKVAPRFECGAFFIRETMLLINAIDLGEASTRVIQ